MSVLPAPETVSGAEIIVPLLDPEVQATIRANPLARFLPKWLVAIVATRLSLTGLVVFVVIVLCAIFAPLITHYSPSAMNMHALGLSPSLTHPFGTNDNGQDIFAQILYGARFSLSVGVAAGIAITVLSILIGMTAGYIGGWIDDALSMVMNVFLILPGLPLLIVISAYVGLRGDRPVATASLMVFVITITGWAWGGRVMRAQTLSLRSRDFVDASIVTGESKFHIIFRDILPNMLALTVNTVILSTLGAILTESALDFLGVGSMNQVTWGTMLFTAESQSTLFTHEWWVFMFPGCAIALTIMSLIFMNNGVDVLANPRLRRIKAPKVAKTGTTTSQIDALGVAKAPS